MINLCISNARQLIRTPVNRDVVSDRILSSRRSPRRGPGWRLRAVAAAWARGRLRNLRTMLARAVFWFRSPAECGFRVMSRWLCES